MNQLLVHGAKGRMGSRILALARDDARFQIAGAIDRDDPDEAIDAIATIDVIIDFSSDDGARRAVAAALERHAALLVGTTGLRDETLGQIRSSASSIPVMIAPNTSRGVAVMNHLAAEAARLLGEHYHVDLIDIHHAAKIDAPSGTALRLASTLREARPDALPDSRIHCLRTGDIIGEHAIHFCGPGEKIILTHAATTRDLFVRGALDAAAWLVSQEPGLYRIEDSLGLGRT